MSFLLFHHHLSATSLQNSSLGRRWITFPSIIIARAAKDPTTFFTRLCSFSSSSSSTCYSFQKTLPLLSRGICISTPGSAGSSRQPPPITITSSSLVGASKLNNWFPRRVSCMNDVVSRYRKSYDVRVKYRHWLVHLIMDVKEFATEQELFNEYIYTAAITLGSTEEARKSIYVVSCGRAYGFGAEMDEEPARSLRGVLGVITVYPDTSYCNRNINPNLQSASNSFIPINQHHRLDSLFSYYHLSHRNSKWNHDHWLISIKLPYVGLGNTRINDICVQMLAEVIGSKEVAKKKIYIIWYMLPFGFAVETDEDTANKLRGLPGVLKVLPDYAFDVKKNSSVLQITPAYTGLRYWQYGLAKESDSEDWLLCKEEHLGDFSDFSFVEADPNSNDKEYGDKEYGGRSDCKHWFIKMEKPSGEDASIEQRIDYCTQTLESAIKRNEAEMKIYRIRCESHFLGVGIKIDVDTANKIKGMHGVVEVLPEYNVTPVPPLSALPLKDRLTDIFSYHHVSEYNSEVNFNHWLIHINQPCDGFGTEKEAMDFCVRILAEVLGSEEDARKKIYIYWCKMPFGFGAEIEEATSNKLKGLPNVLIVLPDHAFNTKNWNGEVLVISAVCRCLFRWSIMQDEPLICSDEFEQYLEMRAMATEKSEDIEDMDSDDWEDHQN